MSRERPLGAETNATLAKELRAMASVCDDMQTATHTAKTDSPHHAHMMQILNTVMGAYWSVKAAALREAAHRLEHAREDAR